MERTRVTVSIVVNVDLDPVPGVFHTMESAQEVLERIVQDTLNDRIPFYHPSVNPK